MDIERRYRAADRPDAPEEHLKVRWSLVLFWVSLTVLLAMLASAAFAGHPEHLWTDKYKNSSGTPCCGETDCYEIEASVSWGARLGDLVPVTNQGVTRQVPVSAIHPSEDGKAYVCWTGCLFRTAGF